MTEKPVLLINRVTKNPTIQDSAIQYFSEKLIRKEYKDFTESQIAFYGSATHVAVYFPSAGNTYEVRGEIGFGGKFPWIKLMGGAIKTEGLKTATDYLVSKIDMDTSNAVKWWEDAVNSGMKYNYPQLLALILVFEARGFFEFIRWVPFQKAYFGERCNSAVELSFRAANIDLLPGSERSKAPGELYLSPYLELANREDALRVAKQSIS